METRPDPDQLLRQVQTQEGNRGKLKIFFGAVAGVGKTYSMLEAARARKKEGIDVVVGYVETHKRSETEALLEGLEILPRKAISYKNVELPEFDIDIALKRSPALILIDELAHTNAPGSRHLKRWQDVEELLNAGIDVYTTLNVQHCESVNDVVAQVTGVIVRETVPDTVLEKADEIELVDLPPDDLLKRLKEGKVYLGPQAERAAEHFFQPGNLIALRQLALRYTTRSVDAKLRSFKEAHAVSKIWNVGERFLVPISESPTAMRLIRAAKRIASEIGAPWTVIYIETPTSLRRTEEDKNRVSEMMRFAEKLGAEVVTLSAQKISDALISYARSKNITKIIVGKPERTRLQEILTGSIINDLARKCGEIDLYILSGEKQERPLSVKSKPSGTFSWRGMFWAAGMVSFCTLINRFLFHHIGLANLIMVYLLGVVWTAYWHGRRISVMASFLSVVVFKFLFIPPYFSFAISDGEYLITFAIMLAVGLLISNLTGRLRHQTTATQLREERTQELYAINRDLAKTSNPDEIFQVLVRHVEDFFKCPACIFALNPQKELAVRVGKPEEIASSLSERAVVEWVFSHKKMAGKGTDTLPSSKGLYLPLVGPEKTVGVLGVFPKEDYQFADPDHLHMLELFVSQTAAAVEGAELAATALKIESEVEKERLQNLILKTFSSDIQEPLSEISKTASELLDLEAMNDPKKRSVLLEKIREQSRRLNELAAELPKIITGE